MVVIFTEFPMLKVKNLTVENLPKNKLIFFLPDAVLAAAAVVVICLNIITHCIGYGLHEFKVKRFDLTEVDIVKEKVRSSSFSSSID